MADVADILGLSKGNLSSEEQAKLFIEKPKAVVSTKKKPKGMSREVFDLIGKDGLVPAVQSNAAPSFKNKRLSALKGKWIWTTINNSSRSDQKLEVHHWAKAESQFVDYAYAKFNVMMEKIHFTDAEYDALLVDTNWTKEDTLELISACQKYDLRWPVIQDRINLSQPKSMEDLQCRYYKVQSVIGKSMRMDINELQRIISQDEKLRRVQLDCAFKKTKEDELEEVKLREELKHVDAALKKLKKTTKPSAPSRSVSVTNLSNVSEASAVAAIARPTTTNPTVVTGNAIPQPQAGVPYLQSSRLYLLEDQIGLNKKILGKMSGYLQQLKMPDFPLPSKAVCDSVDNIRRDTIALLSLHNEIHRMQNKDKLPPVPKARRSSSATHAPAPVTGGESAMEPKIKVEKVAKPASAPAQLGGTEPAIEKPPRKRNSSGGGVKKEGGGKKRKGDAGLDGFEFTLDMHDGNLLDESFSPGAGLQAGNVVKKPKL